MAARDHGSRKEGHSRTVLSLVSQPRSLPLWGHLLLHTPDEAYTPHTTHAVPLSHEFRFTAQAPPGYASIFLPLPGLSLCSVILVPPDPAVLWLSLHSHPHLRPCVLRELLCLYFQIIFPLNAPPHKYPKPPTPLLSSEILPSSSLLRPLSFPHPQQSYYCQYPKCFRYLPGRTK